ncbi:uncharacterized protein LOC124434441 [Xenia sp. Carnegie-2017]|uniref:uncharacterized protein LOC124434441 n=1 Tax=Xenia sp. Carnegie-2017 TaxID=2897299 RepID=UPI001F0403BA|nr:uncharacterized protein LOC124434441 [Xenia sp. Carnegie-2017]
MKRKQKLPRRFPQSRVTEGQTSLKHDLSEKSEVKRVKREQEKTSCCNSELENSMLGESPDSSQGQLLQGKENMRNCQTSQPASSSEEPEQKKSNKTIEKGVKTMDKPKHLMIKFKLDRSKNSWVIAHPEIEKGKSSVSSAPLQPRLSLHERQTSRNHEDIRAFERHVPYAGENFFSNENFGDMPYITKVFSLSSNFYEENVGQKNMVKHGFFPECNIQQSGENCCKPFYPGSIDDFNEKYDGIGKIAKHSEEAQSQSDYQITETWSHSNHTKPLMFYNKPNNSVSQMSTNVLTWDGNWLNKQSKLTGIDQHSTGSSLNTMNNPVTLQGLAYSPLLLISHKVAKEGLMVNGQLINQTGFSHLEALKSVETGNFTSNASVSPYLCKPLLSASILHNMKFKKTVSNDDDVKQSL